MQSRGFEPISTYINTEICMPKRKTLFSAGYDIEAVETVELFPGQVTLVPTGLKAYMQNDEYLGIHIRSGLAVKYKLTLINNQGIIDADYYNNPENEGHILIPIFNLGTHPVRLDKGTRIAQGIFYKYLLTDSDDPTATHTRIGGFGSTGL